MRPSAQGNDMKDSDSSVAIVMGRGGSKRIPRKNIRPFCGKPMICWPVEHACTSKLFREVIISTDDIAIAETARSSGASLHALRPATISDDHATTADVLRYELEEYVRREGSLPEYCCCLYGTSALVTPQLLTEALDMLCRTKTQLVMAVIRYGHPIERALLFDAAGLVHYRQPEFVSVRTQDIPPSYHDAGLFYFFDARAFMKAGGTSFVPLAKTAVEMSGHDAVDIDTEEDWEIAEVLAARQGLVTTV